MKDPQAKKTLRVFGWASFLNDFGSDIIFPLWSVFLTSVLGANMAILGFIDGLGDAIVSISQAISGYIADKTGKRKIFVWLGYVFAGLSRIGYAIGMKILSESIKRREQLSAMKQKDKKDENHPLDVSSDALLLDANNVLESHYAALVYKTAGLLGSERKFEFTPEILAHFVMIISALDGVAVHETEKRLSELKDAEMRAAIESILPRDENIFLLWDVGMQQVALRKGELFARLDAALKSDDLNRLPKAIAELTIKHAKELIEMYQRQYGHGRKCENCGKVLGLVASITTSNPTCGDEEDHIYYLCETEGDYNNHVYFKETIHEEFMTDDVSRHFSKIEQKKAEADIEAIKKCPKPNDKYCECETHKNYRFD